MNTRFGSSRTLVALGLAAMVGAIAYRTTARRHAQDVQHTEPASGPRPAAESYDWWDPRHGSADWWQRD